MAAIISCCDLYPGAAGGRSLWLCTSDTAFVCRIEQNKRIQAIPENKACFEDRFFNILPEPPNLALYY